MGIAAAVKAIHEANPNRTKSSIKKALLRELGAGCTIDQAKYRVEKSLHSVYTQTPNAGPRQSVPVSRLPKHLRVH